MTRKIKRYHKNVYKYELHELTHYVYKKEFGVGVQDIIKLDYIWSYSSVKRKSARKMYTLMHTCVNHFLAIYISTLEEEILACAELDLDHEEADDLKQLQVKKSQLEVAFEAFYDFKAFNVFNYFKRQDRF